jgi:hypothetical protein
MSSALMVLFAIAAFMFIKVVALIVAPSNPSQSHSAQRQQTNRAPVQADEQLRLRQNVGRRASDQNLIIAN